MSSSRFCVAEKYRGLENNIWVELEDLTLKYGSLNLGQGFSDLAPPKQIVDSLANVMTDKNPLYHQYTRGYGHPRLVQALAKLYSHLVGKAIDSKTEILVTAGALAALFCSIMSCINQNDEVIIIEPSYDCYESMVRLAGGIPVSIPLRPKKSGACQHSSDWILDEDELTSKFNGRTKAIIVNTPNNLLGKVFSRSELEFIGQLCRKFDVLCIMDETNEWIVYEPNQHIRMASLPEMWNRTITIGSAGKTFGVTGWNLGWVYGPSYIMTNLFISHIHSVNSCQTPTQEALARALETELDLLGTEKSYFKSFSKLLQPKRDFMASFLENVGMRPIIPEGGYCIPADWSDLESCVDLNDEKSPEKDYRLVEWLMRGKKLAAIPPSAFYSAPNKHLGESLICFCFMKDDSTLLKAEEILREWKNTM